MSEYPIDENLLSIISKTTKERTPKTLQKTKINKKTKQRKKWLPRWPLRTHGEEWRSTVRWIEEEPSSKIAEGREFEREREREKVSTELRMRNSRRGFKAVQISGLRRIEIQRDPAISQVLRKSQKNKNKTNMYITSILNSCKIQPMKFKMPWVWVN